MGTKVAPSLANIFMSEFEEKYVYNYKNPPFKWLRYLDDCLCIWTGSEESLNDFIEHLNSVHPSIKFTAEISKDCVNFLDTKIHLDSNGNLWTDLYCKPTDSHSYLNYKSAHPYHCKKSLPYSQFLRLRRICSNTSDFIRHCGMLIYHFQCRGYPDNILQEGFIRAGEQHRINLLTEVRKSRDPNSDIVMLTIDYVPGMTALQEITRRNWCLLERSSTTKDLAKCKMVVGYRRPKSLRNILVSTKIRREEPAKPGRDDQRPLSTHANACKYKNCRYCPLLDTSGKITSTFSGKSFPTKYNVTCKSSNLIYCITCKVCKKQYVGQTMNRLMDRFGAHFTDILNNLNKDVSRHYNLVGHHGYKDMTIHILDFINAHPRSKMGASLRDIIEFHWIEKLRSVIPFGINTMDKAPVPSQHCRVWKHKKRQ